jgi:GTPase SAR1 family protein
MSKKVEEKGFVFKITVIGDGAVGKTSLIKKYTQGSFQKDYIKTIGAQFSKYNEEINGNNNLDITYLIRSLIPWFLIS